MLRQEEIAVFHGFHEHPPKQPICTKYLAFTRFCGQSFTNKVGPRAAQWLQAEEEGQNGKPKTAIEKIEPIITAALAENSYAEAIRAIAFRISLKGQVQGGRAEEKIVRFQAEPGKAPAMEAILAHRYWQYYEQNRWRFMQRTVSWR